MKNGEVSTLEQMEMSGREEAGSIEAGG